MTLKSSTMVTVSDDAMTVTLLMDNGERVREHVAELLRIPDSEQQQHEMASTASEDYAFWAYHASRARRRSEASRRQLDQTISDTDIAYRSVVDGGQSADARAYGWSSKDFGLITRMVDGNDKVQRAREQSAECAHEYECLRSLAESVRQRNQLLTAVLKGARNF